MYPTPIEKNIYGWGLDIIMCKISLEKKLRVVDEHPLSHLMHEDIHAGIKGNKIVSEIIINCINEKETTNSWR
jgi:hypothetical protein